MATKYERRPLAVNTGERTTIALPARVFRVRLTGLLFETNKTFLLPGAMDGIRGLVDFYNAHPAMGLVVTGHADRVGSAWHNLALSETRAQSMTEFLRDDVEAWLAYYAGSSTWSAWGIREDQHMLQAVPDDAGIAFHAGPVTGWLDQDTRDAVSRFQASRGIEETGGPNEQTRRELVRAYMSLDDTTLPEGAQVERLGCGEHHNALETADGVDAQQNRRVEVFLFDSGTIDPPVPEACPGSGCAYEAWLHATIETIDFEDQLAALLVQVTGQQHDEVVEVLADAQVDLIRDGFPTRTASSDENGQVSFADLTSGRWSVHATKDDFTTKALEIEVHPGGFVLANADASEEPETKSNFAGSPATTPASFAGGAVVMHLKNDSYLLRWIDEPGIEPIAQEKAFRWKDDFIVITPNTGDSVSAVPNANGVFVAPRGKSTSAELVSAIKTGPHETSVIWRTQGPTQIQPGKIVDIKTSSRLRMSLWVFHSPFVAGHKGADDILLDQPSIDALDDCPIDDLSLVHTIGWVENSNPPRVDWKDHAPGGQQKRSLKYLRKLIDILHSKNIRVQAGWTSGDLLKGSSSYNVAWTRFLAGASPSDIDTLAKSALNFFVSQGLDIDGLGFDFEINSLGAAHASNLALLYKKTAEAFRAHKRDAFVTYANGPFDEDGTGQLPFMNAQPFALARDVPNLFARPMCYDTSTFSAEQIRKGIACALRKKDDRNGGELHPSQAQFALSIRELEHKGELNDLITKSLRPNRIGLMLYQLPAFKYSHDPNDKKIITGYSNANTIRFLKDCTAWNQLLNPGEALPGKGAQPLQVPLDLGRV